MMRVPVLAAAACLAVSPLGTSEAQVTTTTAAPTTTTTIPPTTTTTVPATTTTTVAASTTTVTSSTTTAVSSTTTQTSMTTSSTLVTSSTVIFSGYLQLNVFVAGQGAWEFVDTEETNIVDGAVSVPGVFEFSGTATQELGNYGATLSLIPTAPAASAYAKNLSADELTVFVTLSTQDFDEPIGPAVKYSLDQVGVASNALSSTNVDIFDNYIDAYVRPGDIYLGGTDAGFLETTGEFKSFDSGASVADASAAHFYWAFTLGPYDAISIGTDDAYELNIGNQARSCLKKMNDGARKVAFTANKVDAKCYKTEGDITACVDDESDSRQTKTNDKQMENFSSACSIVPDWGVNGGKCCIGGGTTGQSCVDPSTCNGGTCTTGGCTLSGDPEINGLMHDIYGATISNPTERRDRACVKTVTRFSGKVWSLRAKEFTSCKTKSFRDISGDADLKSLCLEPQQADSKGKIAKYEEKLKSKTQKKCIDPADISDLSTMFPGDCAFETVENFGSCVTRLINCRFCQATNSIDDISPGVDCDTFDDGIVNTSCP